ncbi:hypothetical protein GJ744_005775 [Endocarpon pusillum]|uniref:histidine kinase n=1 Tax=Endocarpon pusillum TaxID=364733 RepID=A0A8H7AKS0_9EURO|nr:hypothetical protein GJ744_005775 [Endocarpon pusillum]
MATTTEVDNVPVAGAYSFRPYARSLSHELRTPMQGVIGMLDVMHATVQESIELQQNAKIRNIFLALKNNIEVVQDSSRRAVEAADNIVHAYELNMQIPDTPMDAGDSPATFLSSAAAFESRPHIMIQGGNIAINPRKRQKHSPVSWSFGSTTKRRGGRFSPRREVSPRSGIHVSKPVAPCSMQHTTQPPSSPECSRPAVGSYFPPTRSSVAAEPSATPNLRQSRIRDLVPIVIYEALRVGGRPDSSIGQPTPLGERIEVRTRSSNGHSSYQVIEWSVQPDVPEMLMVDERDLSKLLSCVFLNAIKFTENGTISVVVSLSQSLRSVRINVVDSGAGIPKEFVPQLFKPFSQEDASLTRTREGLGLGLLVAKGIARKLGGDLKLVHTETSGPSKGSEFEIKVPVGGHDLESIPGSPFDRTPTPSDSGAQLPRSDSSYAATSYPRSALATRLPSPELPDHVRFPISSPSSSKPSSSPVRRMLSTASKTSLSERDTIDRRLALKYPLTFLVADDNKINRKLLVNMLSKFGYEDVYEAFDGREAVRLVKEIAASTEDRHSQDNCLETQRALKPVDIVLMDLWMPEMDGYEATEKIFECSPASIPPPTVIAVSADVTEKAISRATAVGMEGFMTKPYKLVDLQRLIEEVCNRV